MEPDAIQKDVDNSSAESQHMTSEQKFTLVLICVCNLFLATYFSMLGPFFPQEANKKGASETMTGLIFGIYAIVVFLTSPFLGSTASCNIIHANMLSLFKMPITFIVYYIIFVGCLTLSFLDVAYSLHLEPFHLSPLLLGIVFLVAPAVYALTAPFLGWIMDKKGWCKSAMALGGMLILVSLSLIGPVPFLSLPMESLWLNVVGNVVLGLGISHLLVPPLQELLVAAFESGYPDNLETYGITSGLYTSAYSIGGFAGAIGGGSLLDKVGFPWTAFIMGLVGASCTLLLALYHLTTKFCCKSKDEIPGEHIPLIP
ncbi:unnamed protein product [Owenia fusiformis]|uniref:Major facilitator superfamily (MFS) profile domain-containing protein n=1 Tax=Owenia fusiformis TaxID=6347 RepID=A0A8S4NK57_OWEFU|nr:unnamed protein product [Owenia fusiformis]